MKPVSTARDAVKKLVAPLPLAYYDRALRNLLKRGDVEFITYKDLDWGNDTDYVNAYPAEWASWRESLTSGRRDPRKIYLLIQHDTDSGPDATIEMTKLELQLGIRSSIMTFVYWRGTSEVDELISYPIDWATLAMLQQEGFIIGYHCNAFQNSRYDPVRVFSQFLEEIDALQANIGGINFFSPHGGRADQSGRVNASFDYPAHTGTKLRWVHNRYSPKFNGYFSDGGLLGRLRNSAPLIDFNAWTRGLIPGRRYRALIHPQYYSDDSFHKIDSVADSWYIDACRTYIEQRQSL